MSTLTLAIPSKGRLMEATAGLLAKAGFGIDRMGADRGYRGRLSGLGGIEVAFLSASEIAQNLRDAKVDLGVTGEDLLREKIAPGSPAADVALRLNFGPADVVVAVPQSWLDVATMADVDEIAESFYERHGRRLRVATKYHNLTRRFFAERGVTGYRIVESLGATEGAPAAGIVVGLAAEPVSNGPLHPAQGAEFTSAYVVDSLCCVSRTTILTGQYPHQTASGEAATCLMTWT